MKTRIKYLLHRLLGFKNYLFLFSLYKIRTIKGDAKEGDFFTFLNMLPTGTDVLDIGANIGIMTVHLAKHVGTGTVHSFEPMPNNVEALERIVKYFRLNNVRIHKVALGNTEGKVEMVMPVISKVRMQGLSHVMHESITEFNDGEKIVVPLTSLDHMSELENSSRPISGIKIDIENYEFFALDGGKGLIRKHQPVVYAELWDNENRSNCFRLLSELGYKIQVSVEGRLVDFDPLIHKKQNFLFIPAQKP